MTLITKRDLNDNIKRQVGNQVRPYLKKYITGTVDPVKTNKATYEALTFEGFEGQEFYSKEEVQKTLIRKYYSQRQVQQILLEIENKLQKGFTEFIASSNSISMDSLKGLRLPGEKDPRYSEEQIIKNVEAGVKGIFDKF